MLLIRDALHPPQQLPTDARHVGLLPQLADNRLGEGFATLHATAGHGPLPLRWAPAPSDHQDLVALDDNRPDAHFRALGPWIERVDRQRRSAWSWLTFDRIVRRERLASS
ncbi:MAG: hypothetical protein NVS3B21_03880 [Acidimicrobiales bacterium]